MAERHSIPTDYGLHVWHDADKDQVFLEQDDELIVVTRARLPWLLATLTDMQREFSKGNYLNPHV